MFPSLTWESETFPHREAHKLNSAKYTLVNVALNCGGAGGGGDRQEKGKNPNLEKHPRFPVRLLRKIHC